jgi:hypothetical protein
MLSLSAACGGRTEPAAPAVDSPRTAQSVAATTASPSPNVEMSRQLGGMQLGMTVEAFVRACRATGAKDIVNERAGTILCTVPPEPLLAKTVSVPFDGVLVGAFCGPDTTACELVYVIYGKLSERDDQIHELLRNLTGQYGPPLAAEGHAADDPARECAAGRSPIHFARSWSFGPKQTPARPVGRVRLVFDCDQLLLFYDDEYGIRMDGERSSKP